jgi:3-phenylpropionate/trans-cinnamate dioxygenase ferredoxin reductase subunit
VRFPSQRYGRRLRLESIQNAIDGAAVVAAAISGEMPCYDPLPIMSSLQFGHQLDFIGLAVDGHESCTLEMGDRAGLVTLHGQAGNCIACECLDVTPDTLSTLRDLITKKAPFKNCNARLNVL